MSYICYIPCPSKPFFYFTVEYECLIRIIFYIFLLLFLLRVQFLTLFPSNAKKSFSFFQSKRSSFISRETKGKSIFIYFYVQYFVKYPSKQNILEQIFEIYLKLFSYNFIMNKNKCAFYTLDVVASLIDIGINRHWSWNLKEWLALKLRN
jgi:hypothetical protein